MSLISSEILQENSAHMEKEYELIRGIFEKGIQDGILQENLDIDLSISHFIYSLHPIAKQSLFSTRSRKIPDQEHYYFSFLKTLLRAWKKHEEI